MSLSLINAPQSIEYVFNPFYFEYSSNNVGKLNFSYVADVYSSNASVQSLNATDIYVGRFKFPVRPVTLNGIFSPSRVLENYVYNSFTADTTQILLNTYPLIGYKIFWGEEYDSSLVLSAATGTTIFSGLTANTGYTMNCIKQYDSQAYPNTYPVNDIYLTDWDWVNNPVKNIRPNEVETIQFIYSSSTLSSATYFNTLNWITTDFSGGTAFYAKTLPFDAHYIRVELPVGTENLDITDTNIVSYTITLQDSNFVTIGTPTAITYNIDYSCERFDPIRINWLTKLGGYDFYTFTLKSWNQINRKNTEWEKFLNYGYKIGQRGRTNLYIENAPKLILTTDWLNDAESTYIQSMFTSPEINQIKYYSDSNTYNSIPLQLTSSSFEKQTKLNSVLVQYTMEFQPVFNIWAQRT